jgi:REP element-mobilizing transposase RayT
MGKPRNENPEGGVVHVYARGNDRCVIFRDDADRELYLRLLAKVREKGRWKVLSYCLMDNHLHMVIETSEGNLGWGMQWLHSQYARAFNRRHGRSGHLFQGRYGSTTIEDDGHLCMTLRYVALNPVKARMCRRPEDWPWSSCARTLRGEGSPCVDVERVLESFDWLGGDRRRRYADMVTPAGLEQAAGVAGPGSAGHDGENDAAAAARARNPRPHKRRHGRRRSSKKRHPP